MGSLRLRDYLEVSRLAHKIVEEKGTSYKEAIEKAKEKLSFERVAAHNSNNNLSKIFNDSITEKNINKK